ncbi:MAG: phosphoribosylformylglycinamidine synthase [Muribaculaceae bacterium]|nr:phosphoribosylformylglycinamidine synthase [Muribaculaceae bacterium]
MVTFFIKADGAVYAVDSTKVFDTQDLTRLTWLFGGAQPATAGSSLKGTFVGPRKEMITPWSTNAVEITQNMGLDGILRIEELHPTEGEPKYDPMLQRVYTDPTPEMFVTDATAAPAEHILDIHDYNEREGLALSEQEENYLRDLSARLGRPLTDSEVFGFSQVNSEHCRHKIFNGTFIIDGEEKPSTLFQLIKSTSKLNPGRLVSAYKDNVAFVTGPDIWQFAPGAPDKPSDFEMTKINTVLSLKAETHNFPTTVEPFNGASTGSGGEIRDRMGGGRASLPLAGTAVYMTSYPRLAKQPWGDAIAERKWLYHSPADILIKASNGASDFGNKFGQPLICGSLLTFEHEERQDKWGYDKVIMLAGGVGYANADHALKDTPKAGQAVMLAGGDNYRIGMGGGAVSSVDTGRYAGAIELNAVQRANPEMQKRVSNLVRALAESAFNPIVSIHDHGAGGHLNALSELIEATGGFIDIDALPVGDPTLSDREIIGNESQERMGFLVDSEYIPLIQRIADRERAPLYVVGETTDDNRLRFGHRNGDNAIDLATADMLGNPPRTVMQDKTVERNFDAPEYDEKKVPEYLSQVLTLESVACKDWLTNKVDRSVTGRIARQQCAGPLQLPVNDCGIVALDYLGHRGIATSIGHAPTVALINPEAGSRLAVAEALTNIVTASLDKGLRAVSLSANWMWPCRNEGEDAALYSAVEACANFANELGINIPTGKDSLSMTQKYPDGTKVKAPGTVIISAAGEVDNIRSRAEAVLAPTTLSTLYYIDFSGTPLALGGSVLAQSLGKIGGATPDVNAAVLANAFKAVQDLIHKDLLAAIHDVSEGGLITALLEMCFPNVGGGLNFYTDGFEKVLGCKDLVKILFAENPAVVIQVLDRDKNAAEALLDKSGVRYFPIASPSRKTEAVITISHASTTHLVSVPAMRRLWFEPSYLLDTLQTNPECARQRRDNLGTQPVKYRFRANFDGTLASRKLRPLRRAKARVNAAIIREKGVNGDREMAYSLYQAGFNVRDVHMTDLTSGRETLDDINMIVFCGGFSNSDVTGSAKGWAGGFKWNERAAETLRRFYARLDTMSLGVCNGCQLMIELNLLGAPTTADGRPAVEMRHNISGKFESEFVGMDVVGNDSVMMSSLSHLSAGIWVAHGEGRFHFNMPLAETGLQVAARYSYNEYPGNPNGSEGAIAALASADGRHLALMPHLERAIFPWQCACYPAEHAKEEVSIWFDAFVNAYRWIARKTQAYKKTRQPK